jgi:hypothetical protein
MRLNPRKIFAHNIKLVFLTEHYVRNAIRRAVRRDRERHMKNRSEAPRPRRPELFTDQYRSRIPRRTESNLRRIDMQEAHSWLRATEVKSVPIGELLNIPSFLSWPDEPQ